MAQRKRKQDRTIGKGKRKNPIDSGATDGAIEGQSPAENSTNRVSHATWAAEKAKQKQIAATKQAETTLVLATPTKVLPAARLTRAWTELVAHSQAPLPPDTTSQALLTQDELALSDEPVSFNSKKVVAGVKLQLHASLYVVSQFDVH